MPRKKFQPSYKAGFLSVGDGHNLYYELWGNPKGKPILFLHGGPGSGFSEKDKRFFDPKIWNVILFDQRGAGRSTPFASIENNTTDHLVEDINKLLDFLKIKKVLLFGGSWGSTLALVYGIRHTEKVSGMIIRGVWLADRASIQHYIEGEVKTFYPEFWGRFVSHVPKNKNVMQYYLEMLQSADSKTRDKFAYEWAFYEASLVSLKPNISKIEKGMQKDNKYISLSLLEAHYIQNNCFLPEGYIEKNASKLKNLPVVIVQGRYDMVCPPIQAWKLHKELPNSKLFFVHAGHSSRDRALEKKLIEEINKFV